MKIHSSPEYCVALLACVATLHAAADAPVFTLSMGIRGSQTWACYSQNRPYPWIRADASSNGEVLKQGNVPFDIQVTFAPNRIDWVLSPSTSAIVAGFGCIDGCCGDGNLHVISPPPSVSCGAPIFPAFVPDWYGGCRPDQWSGAPVMSVIADGLPDPGHCRGAGSPYNDWLLAGCQSGTVRYTFCREDFDASGSIDGGDLGALLACWGAGNETYPPIFMCERVDLDDDGTISGADLGILLSRWGECAIPSG